MYVNIKRDKVRVADGSEAEVSVLDDEQVERFLFHLEKETQRNKAIGYLLLYTGVRVSELVGICLSDIAQLTGELQINGKGGKMREVPIRSDVLKIIRTYIQGERTISRLIGIYVASK